MTTQLSRKIATRLLGFEVGQAVRLARLPDTWAPQMGQEAWLGMRARITRATENLGDSWVIQFTTVPANHHIDILEAEYFVPADCLEAV